MRISGDEDHDNDHDKDCRHKELDKECVINDLNSVRVQGGQKSMDKPPRFLTAVFAVLLVVDVVLIVLHVGFGWSLINLDEEGNLATWYSSAKLLALAVVAGTIWTAEGRQTQSQRRKFRVLWLLVALIFLGLSIDETSSIHERLARVVMQESSVGLDIRETVLGGDATKDAFAWVLIFSPLIVATAVFFLFFFYTRLFRSRHGFVPAMAALGLFLLAVIMESTIYLSPSMREWTTGELSRYRAGIALEESGEILGSTLFLLAFLRYRLFLEKAPTT